MSGKKATPNQNALPFAGDFLLYQTEDGQICIEIRFQDESVWMAQATMAELDQTTARNITLHIKAIYREGELLEQQLVRNTYKFKFKFKFKFKPRG